jgi:hypothetical protein
MQIVDKGRRHTLPMHLIKPRNGSGDAHKLIVTDGSRNHENAGMKQSLAFKLIRTSDEILPVLGDDAAFLQTAPAKRLAVGHSFKTQLM